LDGLVLNLRSVLLQPLLAPANERPDWLLLRAGNERPGDSPAAEQRDELAM